MIEANKDLTLGGQRVPKGKYSVWIVVRQNGNWTTVLDPDVVRRWLVDQCQQERSA